MIATTTGRVYKAASNARDEKRIVNFQLNDMIKLLLARFKHLVQLLSLGDSPREPIKDKATTVSAKKALQHGKENKDTPVFAGFVVLQLVLDHSNHNFVADKTPGVHDFLCLHAERCLLRDLFPKHVASCKVAYTEFFFYSRSLGTFAYLTRCTRVEMV